MMLTRRSSIASLAVMFLIVFTFSFTGAQHCDCCPAHDADESQCVECIYDAPIFIHDQKSSLVSCPAETHELRIVSDQACPADGHPAGIFRPPTALI